MPADPPEGGGKPEAAGAKPPQKPCPVCGKPADPKKLPFCSSRCRDVDLNRWLSGRYVIPGNDTDPDDAD